MVSTRKERTLVVIELNGGNDGLNTVVPYNNGLYYDNRPGIGIPQQEVLPIDGDLGFNPNMQEIKGLWDRGELAVIKGIGYPSPTAPTSGRGISGTRPSRRPSGARAGWERPSGTWTRRVRTS